MHNHHLASVHPSPVEVLVSAYLCTHSAHLRDIMLRLRKYFIIHMNSQIVAQTFIV